LDSDRIILSRRTGQNRMVIAGCTCIARSFWQKSGIDSRRSFLVPQTEATWILFALAIVWTALFFQLGKLPLLQPDEGRNAEVAREMAVSGAWLSPSYNGIAYLDKPAFYFKTVALSLELLGDNEAAARLPSALFGLGLLGLVYGFCRHVHGPRCAILAVIIIATLPLYVINARTVIFDIALAAFVSAAIFAGYLAEMRTGTARRNWHLAGALAAGLATLVKGPVGFLIPGLVLLVFYRVAGIRGVGKRFFAPVNLLVFFGVTLPWFAGLSLQHPDFPHYGLVEESFHRFTTVQFHRTQPFYFYGLIIGLLFLPWSLILPEAAVTAWKQQWFKSPGDRLCLVWAVVVVIFFSLSKSKMPGYILSVTVAGGILVARLFEQALARPEGRAARIAGRGTVGFAGLCVLVAGTALFLSARMIGLARRLGLAEADARALGTHFILLALVLLAFASLAFLAWHRRDAGLAFITFALFPPLLFALNVAAIGVVFESKSARQLAHAMPVLSPQTEVLCWDCFPAGLPFYLQRTVTLATTDGRELTSNYILYRLRADSHWPAGVIPLQAVEQRVVTRDHPVYLLAHAVDRGQVEALAGIQKTNIQPLTPAYVGVLLPAP
jgi:hypothetical protein